MTANYPSKYTNELNLRVAYVHSRVRRLQERLIEGTVWDHDLLPLAFEALENQVSR